MARAHGLYSSDKLALRSLVCSARPIFTLSKVSSKEAKLKAELDRHHALVRYSARNEFCSRAILGDVNGMHCGGEKRRRSRSGISDHNARFDALPMEEQRLHARAAEDVRKRKVREQEAARQRVRDELATLLANDEAARGQRQGICNQVSSCKLSDAELLTMCKIYEEFAAGRRQRPPLFLRAPYYPRCRLAGFHRGEGQRLVWSMAALSFSRWCSAESHMQGEETLRRRLLRLRAHRAQHRGAYPCVFLFAMQKHWPLCS